MAKGFDVTALGSYVEENKEVLIKDIVLGGAEGDTVANLTKQLGIKTKENLNYLAVDPVLQAANGCGFNASGSTKFTQRELATAQVKVNDEYCKEDLLGKWNEYQVRVSANSDALPFEGEIMNGVVKGINKQVEKLVWLGNKSNGDLVDGFVTIAEGADAASTVAVSVAAGTSVYNAIKAVILAIPEDILDKAVVFVSPALYRAYTQELVEKNYYHYDPAQGEPKDMFFPGTSVKVHKTMGLEGDKKHIYASAYENMVYGADMIDAKEEIKAWFSDDNDVNRLKVRFNFGVQTYFPDAVVLGTAASDLI